MKTGFLLLPGGGMSSWIWTKLVPLLNAPAVTPEYRLPENTLKSRTESTIRDCVEHHRALMDASGFDRFVLVGHSGAGALAAAIARAEPERTAAVVYISANIPGNHKTTLDSLPFLIRKMNRRAFKAQVKTDSAPLADGAVMFRKYFCNTCDEDTIGFILAHRRFSEPLCLAFESFDWDGFPQVRQLYVLLALDNTQDEDQQKGMMKNLGITESRTIESDHLPMLSRPEELAAILNSVLGEV